MKQLFIFLFFNLFAFIVNAQNINNQIMRLKLMMLPETSFRFPCGDSVGHGYYIAQGFQDPKMHEGEHLGIDISGIGEGNIDLGDSIYSIGFGIVDYVGVNDYLSVLYKYNNKIIRVVYFHCLEMFPKIGDFVIKGQCIATIGNSNGAYLAHLHLEVISDTTKYAGFYGNPEGFLDPEQLLPFYKKK